MTACWIAVAIAVLAHDPDTSYVRVEIDPHAVRTRLVFDIESLRIIAELDTDGDGQVTRSEFERQLPAIRRFLDERMRLRIDGDDDERLGAEDGYLWPPLAGPAISLANAHSTDGLIIVQFRRPVERLPDRVTLRLDLFDRLGGRHSVLGSFACGDDVVETTYSAAEPEFAYSVDARQLEASPNSSLAARLWRFFLLGVEHIFLGYDHIAFLIALIVVSRFQEIVKTVTAFTVAHSITLILATLQWVSLPSRLIEACIAATIVFVGLENVWVKEPRHRWRLTFCFGLVHGFGFANVLRELGLPRTGLVRCLLSFNLGVEFGQLAIALVLLPLAIGLARWKHGRQVVVAISLALAGLGLFWFVERATG